MASPSIEMLRPLYTSAMNYHGARPWDVLADDDVFGVEEASGVIVHTHLGSPPLDPVFLQEHVMAAVEQARVRPGVVCVRSAATHAALTPLSRALECVVERTTALPMLDEARASLVAAMMR